MTEIREYKCTYSNSVGISAEVTSGLGLEFPDAYMHSETMQILAKAIKEHDGAEFCLLALPDADVTKGRMAEVLDACAKMKAEGETVCLEVTGPFTMLNALMEPRKVFKAYRKDHDGMVKVFEKLGDSLLAYIEAGKKAGVDVFIFSDSAGAPELLGPKFMTQAVEDFYHPFLKKVEGLMDDSCIFLLCPKFTFAVIDTGFGEFREHELEPGIDFLQAMLQMRGKVKIGGQVCIKNIGVKLANGRFREIVLK